MRKLDPIDTYHALTASVVRLSGGSDVLVHTYVGLAIYAGSLFVLRTRRGSLHALQAVFVAEVANEILDRLHSGAWHWPETLGDFIATMAWPIIFYALSRYRRARWSDRQTRTPRTVHLKDQDDYARLPVFAGRTGRSARNADGQAG